MKKLFVLLAAAFAMVACQTDINEVGVAGGEVDVTFEVGTPTRAVYSDGTTATVLQYAVYDEAGELTSLVKTDATIKLSTTVKLQLVTGNTYTVIFWAAAPNAPYTVDFGAKTMTVDYSAAVCNDENRDAFYAIHEFTVKGAQTETIELRRPFAQLNIGTNDYTASANAGYTPNQSKVKVTNIYSTLNLWDGTASDETAVEFAYADIKRDETFPVAAAVDAPAYEYLAMNYLLVNSYKEVVDVEFTYNETSTGDAKTRTVGSVPVQRNHRTNIYGQLLTSDVDINIEIKPEYYDDNKYGIDANGDTYAKVESAEELVSAFDASSEVDLVILDGDINLNDLLAGLLSRAEAKDPSLTITKGKEITLDLGGHTLSATSTQTGKNYEMLLVKGNLTVKNGTIETKHTGDNMEWNNMTTIFDITAGGVLNLEGVTAKNLGGSDMGFVAHLNNWGEVTLNAENCVLESNYVPVRVFNSGPHMNNVTIKNSTLKGVSAAFWVHNYTVADFGTEAKAEAQKSLLNLNIYNQGNTFSPDLNGIRYGFTNSIRSDAYGITKSVSEDGTVVTLGSVIENGLVRRGVAGAEENTTIKKVVVGEGITTLYDRTFRRYYALEEVILPSTLTTIGAAGSGVFQSCTNLKNVVIPESVTTLGVGTFAECTSLTSINIPAGVTRIEKDVFRNTGLTSIEFHAGVTYFGAQAFRDCKQLKEVIINAPQFTVEANAFGVMSGALPGTTIYVANAEMKAYLESTLAYKNQFKVVAPSSVSTPEEFTNALSAGGSISLQENINVEMINLTNLANDVIIDANGKTITTASNYGVQVKAGKNITLKNATVEITVEGNYITYAAGLKIENGDYQGNTITLKDCVIRMCNTDWAYAVNMPASVKNLNLVIDGCTLEGAVALQCWGDNNKITVTNSNLICNYKTNAMYTSYCVALQGDGTNNSENNTLNVRGCNFSYSGVDNFNSPIYSVYNSSKAVNNTITVVDCTYGNKVTAY